MEPEITRHGVLDCQICVPEYFSDWEVVEAAERLYASGTSAGWHIREEGNPLLAGDPERVLCEDRPGFVHLMLEC